MGLFHYRPTSTLQTQTHLNSLNSHASTETFTVQFTNLETGGNKTFTATMPATLATNDEAATEFARQWLLSTEPLAQLVRLTVNANHITFEMRESGRPCTIAAFGGTGTWATTTVADTIVLPNIGPFDMLCPQNYDQKALPGAGDDIIFCGFASPKYNVYRHSTAYGKLSASHDWAGRIGLNGAPLDCTCDSFDFYGRGEADLNLNAATAKVFVKSSATLLDNAPAIRLKGSALDTVKVAGGSVGIASYKGETASVTNLIVSDGYLVVGKDVTVTTYTRTGGNVAIYATPTTVTPEGPEA